MAALVSPPEQSVVIANVSWRTYVNLLEDLAESSTPRLTFDRRTLEIMSPTKKHERLNRVLAQLVEVLTDELGVDMENLGSTTFKREDLERGFEPDSCFYFEQAELVRSKEELDLSVDPSPELVIEIDVTSASIHKDPIYAQLGVREVWRYDGNELRIGTLVGEGYVASETSEALPLVTATVLSQFLERSRTTKRPELVKSFRRWIRESSG
ncbi:MAG: Uma2 family endonuclease [Acidobacteriota bacterium]|nr:MAG: Uma2 family endonuclease [Acidobacteriota bacterium]